MWSSGAGASRLRRSLGVGV
ncbi:BnaC04g43720D [Brassica napus]|uniref:BnaC04g43720D protein n=1 Tax=Brassica napus TaxID=3708 RepID=A0A078GBB9_BRANA|nr:BnaC04g43720D [Brassica napus]